MNWVKQKNLPMAEAITFDNQACTSLDLLWQALHSSYNSANNRPTDLNILNELDTSPQVKWPLLSQHEFIEAIANCSNSSTPGPDHVSWGTLKLIIRDEKCLPHIVRLANACIDLSHWPNHFKESTSVIIPKPQKPSYDTPKAFCPIVLLNTLGKLIEKVIGHRIQHHTVANNFIHPNQLGGIQQRSTVDAGAYLTHIVRAGWTKNLQTSVVAFDIAQFFPLLNHDFLSACISKAGFDNRIMRFFANYVSDRHTNYRWNNDTSSSFPCSVGVGQESALSPILSALYLSPLLKIFQKRKTNTETTNKKEKIMTDILLFVDDGLLISQEKSLQISHVHLSSSYRIISQIFDAAGLVVEHSKTELFHFTRQHLYSSPSLDLTPTGGHILQPKPIWRYLGFFFDRKLSFHHHCHYYATKSISTIRGMKLLGSSTRGLNPMHKHLLYRTCILPIALYSFQLW